MKRTPLEIVTKSGNQYTLPAKRLKERLESPMRHF
jgi:hypothetical protein